LVYILSIFRSSLSYYCANLTYVFSCAKSRMGMTKQDLAKHLKNIKVPNRPTLARNVIRLPSDDEETVSGQGFVLSWWVLPSWGGGNHDFCSVSFEHDLSFIWVVQVEGSSTSCQSFWDPTFCHTTHGWAHNIFEGELMPSFIKWKCRCLSYVANLIT